MLRDDIKGLQKASARDLRKFGLTVGGVFLGLGLLFYFRHKPWWPWFIGPGVPLIALGAILPRGLKWIYVAWMTLAMVLGAIVSTILLTLLFCVVVTPIGWIARLAGKDFLSRKPKQPHEHEQQF
jgi:polyferredoxin